MFGKESLFTFEETKKEKESDSKIFIENSKLISGMNCKMIYKSNFIPKDERNKLYSNLLNTIEFKDRKIDGKVKLNRATAVFGDQTDFETIPKIWGDGIEVKIFPTELKKIRDEISNITGAKYNICLCNFYANGKKTIGYHSDREENGSISNIASISLGAERKFIFREKNSEKTFEFTLENGSLIVMGDKCQERYEHAIMKDENLKEGRINLTFRLFDVKRYSIFDKKNDNQY